MHYKIYEFNDRQEVDGEVLNLVLEVDMQVPEFNNKLKIEKLTSRLTDKNGVVVIAYDGSRPVGYKIGYALSNERFYSWLGAVESKHRKRGIAAAMLKQQETWVTIHRYKEILVRSMNQFPGMLHMLISHDYQVSGYIDNGNLQDNKICFVKKVNS